ncbi:seipin-like isoform X2 [Ruditapes philippinarum]|uniref:seipin-like isoform X2 n=1 Tax=Ruditapes philippinarum TaxID=129788 RepID=UPI00295B5B90|nr:seipin-like isoform X2 [Ruditapes philippinarum]
MMKYPKFINSIKLKIDTTLSSFSEYVQKAVVFIATVTVIFWFSVFLYGSYYYYYVPEVAQERQVYFHFRVCETGVGLCSFPIANISLLKEGKNEVFNVGQSYRIVLDLDVPESDVNRNIGMFMIEMRLYNKRGEVVQTSARATSVRYKSDLLRTLETFAFLPLFLFGYMHQKQFLHVDLFPDFMDNAYNPTVGLVVEVQSKKVEVYTAVLKVFAQFSGIRYFLYYWPLTSAVIGITWNFVFLSFIALLSWYQFWFPHEKDGMNQSVKINLYRNRKPASPKKPAKVNPQPGSTRVHEAETVGASEETELLAPATRVDSGLRLRQPHSETVS